MAFSKAHKFTPPDFYLSLIGKAISHPARIVLIRRVLLREESISAGELIKGIPLSRPTLSEHLRILREMHILRCEGSGANVTYWLNPALPVTRSELFDLIVRAGHADDMRFQEELGTLSGRRTDGSIPL